MHINSKDNPRVKLFRKLLSSKKAREEHGLFAVEGARNCVDTAYEAVCGRIKVHSVFYTQTALTKYKNTLKTDSLFSCTRPEDVFEISDELAKKMTDEGNSQGIYMIVFKVDLPFVAEYIDKNGKYLVLDNLQDPGNLGTLLRTADAVGVSGVVMTDNCVD
ncbi:TrmH family RNA methyltransferase, partial [Ruminococcus bicirculans (ex Wegman et al. 2014)]|uniref:TrmH family RNA methyltransferase n=2 Tax=Oscillospiraceae TaxID=216572 RepID=UPI00402A3541